LNCADDRNQDPSIVGNRVEKLLTGDSPTMPLVTGLSVKSPLPAEADDMVNTFNPIQDGMQNVYGEKEAPVFPHVTDESNAAWVPRGQTKAVRDITDAWKCVGDTRSKLAVDLWAKRLGFDEETVKRDDKEVRKFSPLTGAAPKELLSRFRQVVPALPLVAVGV
jgi:hypothetical protein